MESANQTRETANNPVTEADIRHAMRALREREVAEELEAIEEQIAMLRLDNHGANMDDKVKEAVLELERAISSLSALVDGREIRDSGLCSRIIAGLNGVGGPGLLYLVGYDGPCCDASSDGYHAPWCGR